MYPETTGRDLARHAIVLTCAGMEIDEYEFAANMIDLSRKDVTADTLLTNLQEQQREKPQATCVDLCMNPLGDDGAAKVAAWLKDDAVVTD
eukprot:gene6761-6462_t